MEDGLLFFVIQFFRVRDPTRPPRNFLANMPSKKGKDVPTTDETEIPTGTSASSRMRNNTGTSAASRTRDNGGTSASSRTRNNAVTSASNRTRNNVESSASRRTSTMNQTTTTNETFSDKDHRFVLLRDEQTSRHFLFRRDQLSCSKKNDFKIGTYATFHGDGDQSARCRGVIVLSGKNEET